MLELHRPSRLLLAAASAAAAVSFALVPFGAPAAALGAAQDAPVSLEEDLRYARGLASRFQFLDLADAVIQRVATQKLGAAEQEALALAQAEIFGEGARFESDPEQRRQLFHQALDAYRQFLEQHPLSPHAAEARRAYVNFGATYGWLVEQELAEASGERREALQTEATERLLNIASYTGEAIDDFGEPANLDELQKRDLAQLLLARGQLLLQMARLSDEAEFYLETGSSALEDLVFIMGGETGWALNAYILLAEIEMVRGDAETALAFVDSVIASAIPMDREAWDAAIAEFQLTRADKDARWQFIELATPLALRCARDLGDTGLAMQFALHFYNTRAREGFNLSARGYGALLDVARALIEAGGVLGGAAAEGTLEWYPTTEEATAAGHTARNTRTSAELALSLASTVNEDNPRTYLQTQAQRVISEAIAVPGITVSIDVLFQAALGEFNAENWSAAVPAFKRVLAAARTPVDRAAWGGRVYLHVGRALQKQDRMLEAAMAFEEGARNYRDDQETAAECAKGFYQALSQVQRKVQGDETINALWLDAERLAAEIGTSDSGDIFYRQGERSAAEAKHEEARRLFQQVPPESRRSEPARVKAAVSLYSAGQLDAAGAELNEYLTTFVEDPRNRLGPQDHARIDAREAAKAEADYFLGRIDFDREAWDAVVERYDDFDARYPTQVGLIAAALDHAASAELARGNADAARRYLARLREQANPDSARIANVASRLYNDLVAKLAAADAAGNADEILVFKRQMAELLAVSNSQGRPDYTSLRTEGLYWLDVGEPQKAEAALQRFLAEFGDEPKLAQIRDEVVKPALAETLLRQRRAQEAFDLLVGLVPKEGQTDGPRLITKTAEAYVQSVAGWLELGDGGEPVIVPGVGGLERLAEAGALHARLANRPDIEAWSCQWLRLETQSIWIMVQMGRLDSARMQAARKALDSHRAFLGGDTFPKAAAKCDGDTRVQRLLQWLNRQVK